MASGVIIAKSAEGKIPDEILAKAFKENPHGYGCMMVDDGAIDMICHPSGDGVKWVKDVQDNYPDTEIWFYFSRSKDTNEDSLQPFLFFKNENDETILAGMLAGDYSNHRQSNDGKKTDEFYAAYTYIIPKLNKVDQSTGDREEFYKELEDPLFMTEMKNLAAGPHVFIMLKQDGGLLNYSRGASVKEEPWGWTTMTEEAPATEEQPKEEPKKKVSKLQNLKTSTSMTPPAEAPAPEPPKEEPPKKEEEKPEPKTGRPPNNLKTKSEVRGWYEEHNAAINPETKKGQIPEGYMKRPAIILRDKPLKSFQDIPKETVAPAKEAPQEQPNADVPLTPIISPSDKKMIEDMISSGGSIGRLIDASSKELAEDPKKLQEMEKKWPSFAEQIGLADFGLDVVNDWPLTAFEVLVAESPHAAAVLLMNFRNSRLIEKSKQPQQKKEEQQQPKASKLSKLRSIG